MVDVYTSNVCRTSLTETQSIMIAAYPEEVSAWCCPAAEAEMDIVKDAIHGAR
jgi:hypothetical protein